MGKELLFGKSLLELEDFCQGLGWPKYRARQLYAAMYAQYCADFAAMTVLGRVEREFLGQHCQLAAYEALQVQRAADGTLKFLYPLEEFYQVEGNEALKKGLWPPWPAVECVLIPGKAGEYTLCLSSQWGCRWACQFCQTGEMGLKRQLSAAEILAQLRCAQKLLVDFGAGAYVSRIVFMGMGEPLENPDLAKALAIFSDATKSGGYGFSARRITVSTVGLVEPLREFLALPKPYRLAISVHNPISEERSRLIPAEFSSPLEDVLGILQRQTQAQTQDSVAYRKRRITFEYTLVAGENDQNYHAEALAEMALGVNARVNLIACHSNSAGYLGSDVVRMQQFQSLLEGRGVRCTIRKSQGEEIQAACGMLAGAFEL